MRKALLSVVMGSLFALACSAGTDVGADESEDLGSAALSNPNYGYFTARMDLRKCMSPMCGGWFVSRVNNSKTRCVDGSYASECYVEGIDLSATNLTDVELGGAVLRGAIAPVTINGQKWGSFAASEVWVPQTGSQRAGNVWRAKDNGIRCIKAPCPSVSAAKLDTNAVRMISEVDLASTSVPATQKQIDVAMADVMSGADGLLVAGTVAPAKGGGNELVATEFYRRARNLACGSRGLGPCAKDEYCAFGPKADCGRSDAPGTCTKRPQICPQLYKPVCGCDGTTYSNACTAGSASVSVEHDGACK